MHNYSKEELASIMESLSKMEDDYLQMIKEQEQKLEGNEYYAKIKDLSSRLLNIRDQKMSLKKVLDFEKFKEPKERVELDKIAILNAISQFFINNQGKPSSVAEIINYLKQIELIPTDSNPGIAVGSFMRSDKRFKFLPHERMWVLNEITSSKEGQTSESSNETNDGSMNT